MRAVLIVFLAACLIAAERSPEARAWWAHIEYLASDALQGRRTGTPGHTKAAEYVAGKFDRIGLQPGGSKTSFLQPVSFETRQLDEKASSLELVLDGKPRRIVLGEEANLGVRVDRPGTVEVDYVFVGHGLQVPEAKIDDLAGLDLKGKVAFYLSGAPSRLPAPLAAHVQSTAERWRVLKQAGAIGTMSVSDPKDNDIPWSRSTLARLTPTLTLTEPALIDNAGVQVSITVNPEHADLFLAESGHSMAKLLDLHRRGQALPRFQGKAKLRVKTAFSIAPAKSDNAIGVLRGSGDESIVISAHLDHLGVGGAIAGDSIYNGAMDNASGIASILEIAQGMARKRIMRKRSVIFAAVTGEEGGLMGSKHLAAHSFYGDSGGVPKTVADINLDMFLPIVPLKAITVYGMDESDLGAEFAAVAAKFQVKTERDPEPERRAFIRSDQYSFIRKGIPALTFKFHAPPGTPEGKIVANWRKERYHAPSDDLLQPVEVEDAVKFNRILAAFIEQLASQPERPQWKPDSFFRRYAQ